MFSKVINQVVTDQYALYHGDCTHAMRGLPSNSIHLSVKSVPFPGMWVYSNSKYDMGNVSSIAQMIEQYRFAMRELLRVMVPGRSCFIHLTQGVAQKQRDGYMGLKDFRGEMIKMMVEEGWIHYGENVIDKDPQLKAMRTKDHGLMFKSLATDASRMHSAMPDFMLQFQKPGINPIPIPAGKSQKYDNPNGWVTSEEWILWARGVWYGSDYTPGSWTPETGGEGCPHGIRETEVLNVSQARDTNDERHLCPLQLGAIERVIAVWSNPGEIVLDDFGGIGSTGYQAIKMGRKAIMCELKESYFKSMIRNMERAVIEASQASIFDFVEVNNALPEPV